MRKRRLEVSVTFDERRGYVGTAPKLRAPLVALSLSGLRRQVEAALMPGDPADIKLELDRAARIEHDQRRRGGCVKLLTHPAMGSSLRAWL
jgi:hypothetical protein